MGKLFTEEVGKLLTRLLGNYLTAILGKVLDIYKNVCLGISVTFRKLYKFVFNELLIINEMKKYNYHYYYFQRMRKGIDNNGISD